MAPGQNCKFFKFLLSVNSQRRLGYKENNTKYRSLTRKPRSHVRILIYRTWPIDNSYKLIEVFSGRRGTADTVVNVASVEFRFGSVALIKKLVFDVAYEKIDVAGSHFGTHGHVIDLFIMKNS